MGFLKRKREIWRSLHFVAVLILTGLKIGAMMRGLFQRTNGATSQLWKPCLNHLSGLDRIHLKTALVKLSRLRAVNSLVNRLSE